MTAALARHCDGYLASRSAVLLLPALAMALAAGDARWLSGGMLAVCCLIAMERGRLGALASLVQAGSALGGVLLLAWLWRWSAGFALACGLAAELGCRLGRHRAAWRSVANFTFIPALYLAYEMAERGASPLAELPWLAGGALAAWALHLLAGRRGGAEHKPGEAPAFGLAFVCVGLLAWWAAANRLPGGQWLVWSAASVCVGGWSAARDKSWQRVSAALVGVPCGVGLGLLLNDSAPLALGMAAAGMLSLTLFRAYRPAFAVRSALASAHLTLIGGMGLARLLDVGAAAALVLLVLAVGGWLASPR
ncbi:FUSC family protein [Chromobacterium violaceum]|uniref:FUSC family protein n=1 Tax=Chromobacterium violaceum TaxID=536 RepID=UPI0009DA2D84|nr:FUSC family protein [Chromobacterium violaceum]OQS46370.1 hypothetical protein B0T48_16635 [Chromobacterium violaceum]OQS48813.1 hypothetical protein B0T49_15420 [Chromobacterium violaceum]QRO32173.1 hypothetical protein I6K04_17025 [Chromobacterium violaceum]QRQ18026.1 hypothetical protein I6K03_05705 [Chromobacterium violaceum]